MFTDLNLICIGSGVLIGGVIVAVVLIAVFSLYLRRVRHQLNKARLFNRH